MNNLSMSNAIKLRNFIKQQRNEKHSYETEDSLQTRQQWISKLMVNFHEPSDPQYIKGQYGKETNVIYNSSNVMTCEMYLDKNGEAVKGKWDIPQFFNKNHNTRKKMPCETIAEIDNVEDFEECFNLMQQLIESLMDKNYHFAVFYAVGGRSFHIRIYDFDQLKDLTAFQREQAQLIFWKSIVPWADKYLDKAVWEDEHPLQLEFAPHWKHGSLFDLVFEYCPKKQGSEIQCKL